MKGYYLIFCSMIVLFLCCGIPVQADDMDLAEEYAPILYFTSGEYAYPVAVDYFIEHSQIYQFFEESSVLIDSDPTIDSLGQYRDASSYFLDNQLGGIEDTEILNNYQNDEDALGYTVYVSVTEQGGQTIVQYWFFYVFNKGELNVHEGDWEVVQVVLSGGEPTQLMVSQHHSGQQATWDQIEREEMHPKVFVAQGSHAKYLRSFSGKLGLASDYVAADGKVLTPEDYSIVLLTNQSWLEFTGHWGEYESIEAELRGKVGPFGPKFREQTQMWSQPLSWGSSLPQLNENLLIVEWFLYHIIPIYLLITLVVAAVLGFSLYRRYKKQGLGPRWFSILYIDGMNMKSMGNLLCILSVVLIVFGLVNQWYGVSAQISAPGLETTGFEDIILIDGVQGIQLNLLDNSGQLVQMGSFVFPFALFIGIGLVFFILGTAGIHTSKKLGKKYVVKGIRICLIIVFLLIGLLALGMVGNILGSIEGTDDVPVNELLNSISSSPIAGEYSMQVAVPESATASAQFSWGLRIGGFFMLIGGVLLGVAGFLEYRSKSELFIVKQDQIKKREKPSKQKPVTKTKNK